MSPRWSSARSRAGRTVRPGLVALGIVVAIGVTAVAAGCGGSTEATTTVTVAGTTTTAELGAQEQVLVGHIKSLVPKGQGFELKFDPVWILSGTTAERAAVEDGVLQPGEPVPNDHYTVEEGHRLLTYDVLSTADVTLIGKGLKPLTVPVSELAQIVQGKNPKQRALFDPSNQLGYRIRVGNKYPNPVVSLEQAYQP